MLRLSCTSTILLASGKCVSDKFLEDLGIIHRSVAVGDLDMAPAFQRGEHHEQIGRAIALVLVIKACGPSWLGCDRHAAFRR